MLFEREILTRRFRKFDPIDSQDNSSGRINTRACKTLSSLVCDYVLFALSIARDVCHSEPHRFSGSFPFLTKRKSDLVPLFFKLRTLSYRFGHGVFRFWTEIIPPIRILVSSVEICPPPEQHTPPVRKARGCHGASPRSFFVNTFFNNLYS